MKTNTIELLLGAALLLTAFLTLAACGVFNLGSTNEDGTPKTAADARAYIRGMFDAAGQLYGVPWLHEHAPQVLEYFDVDRNGVPTLQEVESKIDLTNPASAIMLLDLGRQLYEAKKAGRL